MQRHTGGVSLNDPNGALSARVALASQERDVRSATILRQDESSSTWAVLLTDTCVPLSPINSFTKFQLQARTSAIPPLEQSEVYVFSS